MAGSTFRRKPALLFFLSLCVEALAFVSLIRTCTYSHGCLILGLVRPPTQTSMLERNRGVNTSERTRCPFLRPGTVPHPPFPSQASRRWIGHQALPFSLARQTARRRRTPSSLARAERTCGGKAREVIAGSMPSGERAAYMRSA